jgi:hypothetical protein
MLTKRLSKFTQKIEIEIVTVLPLLLNIFITLTAKSGLSAAEQSGTEIVTNLKL